MRKLGYILAVFCALVALANFVVFFAFDSVFNLLVGVAAALCVPVNIHSAHQWKER